MNLRRIALSLILAISLISGLSAAEDSTVSMDESDVQPGDVPEPTVTEDTDVVTAAPEEAGAVDEAAVADAEALEGSWILSLDDLQISMVMYQSGDLLFGAANSETPNPWNGVVSGSVNEDAVELEILSLQDGVLVSTLISGTATTDGSITGRFVQSDSEGKVNEGKAMGFLISLGTSEYEPAVVPKEDTSTVAPATPALEEQAAAPTPDEDTTEDGKKTPVDVTKYMDQYYAVGAGTTPI